MKNNYFLLLIFNLFFCVVSFSQNSTISGSITNGKNGEDLFGASIRVKELQNTGARTNIYGFYSLSIPKGEYTLIYAGSALENKTVKINLKADTTLNIELFESDDVQELDEIGRAHV